MKKLAAILALAWTAGALAQQITIPPQGNQIIATPAYPGGPNANSAGSAFGASTAGRRCNRFATFGDSKEANGYVSNFLNVQSTTGGLVSDGTTVTVVTTAAAGAFMVGNYALFSNLGDANANDQGPISALSKLNGQLLPITGQPTTTSFTVSATTPRGNIPSGDYSTVGGNAWTVIPTSSGSDGSFFRRLQELLPNPPMLTAPYAVSGTESGYSINLVQQSLLQGAPYYDCAVLDVGTNNIDIAIGTSYAAAQAAVETVITNDVTAVNTLLAAGKQVFLLTQPPSSYSGFTSTQLQQVNICLLKLRHRIYDTFGRAQFVKIIDVMRDVQDGTAANGGYVTGFSGDGIHLWSTATLAAVKAEVPSLTAYFNSGNDWNPLSLLEDVTSYTQTGFPNLVVNPAMQGTSGTVFAPVTGTAPNGWDVLEQGGAAGISASQQTRQNIPASIGESGLWGWGLNLNITWSGASQAMIALSSLGGNLPVAGNCYHFGYTLTALGAATGLTSAHVAWTFAGGNTSAAGGMPQNSYGQQGGVYLANGLPLVTGDQLQVANDVTCIPPTATFTNTELAVVLTSSGSGTSNVQISNAFIRQVPSNVWTTAANDPRFDPPFYLRRHAA